MEFQKKLQKRFQNSSKKFQKLFQKTSEKSLALQHNFKKVSKKSQNQFRKCFKRFQKITKVPEKYSKKSFSLPIFPSLKEEDIIRVIALMKDIFCKIIS